jgi:hypothetical protein
VTLQLAAFPHSPRDLPDEFEDRRVEREGLRLGLRLGDRFGIRVAYQLLLSLGGRTPDAGGTGSHAANELFGGFGIDVPRLFQSDCFRHHRLQRSLMGICAVLFLYLIKGAACLPSRVLFRDQSFEPRGEFLFIGGLLHESLLGEDYQLVQRKVSPLINLTLRHLYEGDRAPDLVLLGLQGFALKSQDIPKPGMAPNKRLDRFEG